MENNPDKKKPGFLAGKIILVKEIECLSKIVQNIRIQPNKNIYCIKNSCHNFF